MYYPTAFDLLHTDMLGHECTDVDALNNAERIMELGFLVGSAIKVGDQEDLFQSSWFNYLTNNRNLKIWMDVCKRKLARRLRSRGIIFENILKI